MKKVMLGEVQVFRYEGPDNLLNFDRLMYMSKEESKDITIILENTGEELLRIGKGHALNKGE